MKHGNYEHTLDLREAQKAASALRSRCKRLWWISGGAGYDNMGSRELQQVRVKLDELEFWLAAASRSLAAGGERAVAAGYAPDSNTGSERDS